MSLANIMPWDEAEEAIAADMSAVFAHDSQASREQSLAPSESSTQPLEPLTSELTLGLLHQVNNVLTGVYFNLEECQELVAPEHPASDTLAELADAVQNIHRLLERTVDVNLAAARDDASYHELEALVARQLDLIRIVLPKTTQIELLAPGEPLHIHASEHEFRRVLVDLAVHCRHALPADRARVTIEILPGDALVAEGLDLRDPLPGKTAVVVFRAGLETRQLSADPSFQQMKTQAAAQGWRLAITPHPAVILPLADLDL